MQCTVSIPYDLINPLGSPDPQIQQLAMWAVTVGAPAVAYNDHTDYSINTNKLPLQVAQLIVSKWWDVTNYPTWIVVDDKDAQVTFENIDIPEEGMTRAERATHDPVQGTDNKRYISCSNGNIERPLSELVEVFSILVDKATFISKIPSDNE